jgi:hypothetical protein
MTALPIINSDTTIDAVVEHSIIDVGLSRLLRLRLPCGLGSQHLAGRYFLARCGAQTAAERQLDWHLYFRRALFVAQRRTLFDKDGGEALHDLWTLILPHEHDPGREWLEKRSEGETINLIGPVGNAFELPESTRNLLLIASAESWPALLPLLDPILDRGGRVTFLITDVPPALDLEQHVLPHLPLPVELRLTHEPLRPSAELTDALRWADQLCAALPSTLFTLLSQLIRDHRFRLEAGFAQMLVEADYVCGVGSCLACVVPTERGSLTRACIHGPAMDLSILAR